MTTALSVDRAFLDLVCADEELLTAEFEAIITASWDDPVPPGAVLVRTGGGRWPAFTSSGQDPGAPMLERASCGGRGGRQRSPPGSDAGVRFVQGGEAQSLIE